MGISPKEMHLTRASSDPSSSEKDSEAEGTDATRSASRSRIVTHTASDLRARIQSSNQEPDAGEQHGRERGGEKRAVEEKRMRPADAVACDHDAVVEVPLHVCCQRA